METTIQLGQYVLGYYAQFMSDVERRTQKHLAGAMKATRGRSDVAAQSDARNHPRFSEWLSDDPEVLSLAASGYDAFVERTATRILKEHDDKIFLNRCPSCGGLAKTPKAKQCRFCRHDWHS